MNLKSFTGGIFDTNCFLVQNDGQTLLIDAPQGCADWIASANIPVDLLLLTHGHIDHVIDAARLKRDHGCKVGYHADGARMLTEPDFFVKLGFQWEIEPVTADFFLSETDSQVFAGIDFQVLEVPGHCPGSLCFLAKNERVLFGGDVLFSGGVGRWDLPGGDRDLLFSGIKSKVYPLGDDVTVLPGHGPATKIGVERRTNPFVSDDL